MKVSAEVFACHEKACAPPPAGKGGSSKGRSSIGLTKPTTAGPDWGVRNSGSRVGWQRGRGGNERLEVNGRFGYVKQVRAGTSGERSYEGSVKGKGTTISRSKDKAQKWVEKALKEESPSKTDQQITNKVTRTPATPSSWRPKKYKGGDTSKALTPEQRKANDAWVTDMRKRVRG